MPGKYDKILRENIETIIPFIIEHLLGIPFDATQIIKDKLQVTIERETDYLCLILRASEDEILHLEFQTGDDKHMPSRMLMYMSILHEKYQLNVLQYVIYLGSKKKPNIPTGIRTKNLNFQYQLLNLRDFPAEIFLNANTPEGVILAVLGEFNQLTPREIIQKILERIQELPIDGNRLHKSVVHLRILSQLRKLQTETSKQIELMSSKIDIRKDPFYQKGKIEGVAEGIEKGIEKGIEEQSHLFVISLLENTDFDDQKIALIARVSIEYVRKVKKEAGL